MLINHTIGLLPRRPLQQLYRLLLAMSGALLLSGCSGLFFLPAKQHFTSPEQFNLRYQDVSIATVDGETLHGWLLQSTHQRKGIVYFLHGNAENISTHIGNVMWLPNEGYDVFLLDYRGFGKSTGNPDLAGALADIDAGYRWLATNPTYLSDAKFILGQSLGAALTLSFASQQPDLEKTINGIVVDAGFPSFRGIAREKLGGWWLTWPIQYPLSWLIPSQYDTEKRLNQIAPTPLLVIHSTNDQIIPFHHGEYIYNHASTPKQFLKTDTPHSATFRSKQYREELVNFMEKNSGSASLQGYTTSAIQPETL